MIDFHAMASEISAAEPEERVQRIVALLELTDRQNEAINRQNEAIKFQTAATATLLVAFRKMRVARWMNEVMGWVTLGLAGYVVFMFATRVYEHFVSPAKPAPACECQKE